MSAVKKAVKKNIKEETAKSPTIFGVCFTEDTLIKTNDGHKQIKDIKVGDKVYAENVESGIKGYKRVKQIFMNDAYTLLHITVKDTVIKTTLPHPFYVVGKGWVEAKNLKVGDVLKLANGETTEVKALKVEELESPVKVYNFEVEDWHTYYVSENEVLVHNSGVNPCSASSVAGNGGRNTKLGSITGYKFKSNVDIDLRGSGNYNDALNMAFRKTGLNKSNFKVTKWAKDANGKSYPVEWKASNGAEVSIDIGHVSDGPDIPHIGYQTGGKRGNGGAVRGHIFVDGVPVNR